MAIRSIDRTAWAMSRPRSDSQFNGIPGTVRGAGSRVARKRHKTRVMGLTALGEAPPRVIEELEHRAFLEMPTVCGKCSSPHLIWQREVRTPGLPRRVFCHACGWDTFFAMASQAEVPVLMVPVERGQSDRGVQEVRVEDVFRRERKSTR